MNKFRRFLGRISVETCLKMDYFGSVQGRRQKNFQGRWGDETKQDRKTAPLSFSQFYQYNVWKSRGGGHGSPLLPAADAHGSIRVLVSSKSPKAGVSPPDPRLDSMNRKCAKTLLPLNISGWCRCLEILEQNETLLFYLFCPFLVQKSFLHHWGGWYLSTLQTKFNIF